MHEAQLHKKTCFITLTYDDKRLSPRDASSQSLTASRASPGSRRRTEQPACQDSVTRLLVDSSTISLIKRHLQLFMKRLRAQVAARDPSTRVKFFACGEYGDKLGRPHYHLALFGEDFRHDRYPWRNSKGKQLDRSASLEALWPYGNVEIGDLEPESAMYIASYVTKKITGKKADEHYRRTDECGNDYWLEPEFSLMSRGGRTGRGLAHGWFQKYNTDVFPHDHVIVNGKPNKTPKYYDKLFDQMNPIEMAFIKLVREGRASLLADDNTPARLADKETVTKAKLALKKRNLEST